MHTRLSSYIPHILPPASSSSASSSSSSSSDHDIVDHQSISIPTIDEQQSLIMPTYTIDHLSSLRVTMTSKSPTTHIICQIVGPVQSSDSINMTCDIQISYKTASYASPTSRNNMSVNAPSSIDQLHSETLSGIFKSSINISLFPQSDIHISILVLQSSGDDFYDLSQSVNLITMALMANSIPLYDMPQCTVIYQMPSISHTSLLLSPSLCAKILLQYNNINNNNNINKRIPSPLSLLYTCLPSLQQSLLHTTRGIISNSQAWTQLFNQAKEQCNMSKIYHKNAIKVLLEQHALKAHTEKTQ